MVSIHAPVKVRLEYDPKTQTLSGVSIHAPVKVRLFLSEDSYLREVSIHAPVKVRRHKPAGTSVFQQFQFTHP